MSLATTSGGGMGGGMGGAGLSMAHGNAIARANAPPPPPQGSSIPGGIAPPSSAAALGADLIDKHQQALSSKQARNLSHMPIVAVDLYANEPTVAMFPPKIDDAPEGTPVLVGKMKPDVYLHGENDTAYKTLRKYLAKEKFFSSLQTDTLAKADDANVVKMERPQQWLGLRRTKEAPDFVRKGLPDVASEGAISEEASLDVGATISNSTLDGSEPTGDDFDRVVFKVRLTPKKKVLPVLPEEGVEILLHQARSHVAKKIKAENDDDEEITQYPCAVALPAWQCHDASVEALMDGLGGGGVIFQRSICAVVGALRPGPKEKPNTVLKAINDVRQQRAQEFQKERVKNPDATMVDDVSLFLFGMTCDGFECTAVQVSCLQQDKMDSLFGDINVVSNVSYQSDDPSSIIEKCVVELEANLKELLPGMEMPPAIVTYGSIQQQNDIKSTWDKIKEKSVNEWKDIPIHSTKTDCVAMGTATLGAVSHGRLRCIQEVPGKKSKAILAIRVANVSPVAVGIRMNYHGDKKKKWTAVKTIFDFDRRVPAGPYAIDLKASECVVHREGSADMSDDEFLKAATAIEGSKGIPQREEAALNLRVQIFQKWTRDGEWKPVGNSKKGLVMDGKDGEEVACEHSVLELSLGPTGIITAGHFGEGESVVQATVSARNSKLRYWIGIILAVVFFGGFLVKSYWEERVFERDTKRLLAYYKHATPGSFHDGDEHNARYLVWKYRGKKDKLWRMLERKYEQPVLQAWEYPEPEEKEEEEEPEEHNLDEDEDKPSGETAQGEDAESETEQKEEPDL